MLNYLEANVDESTNVCPAAEIVLVGDFNQISDCAVIQHTGLNQIVRQPTRGHNILDRVFESSPIYCTVRVIASTVKSDHRVIVAYSSENLTTPHKTKVQAQYRTRTPNQHAALLSALSGLSWDSVLQETDVQKAFDVFYAGAMFLFNQYYPMHTITLSNRDPQFITPRINSLLRQRNRLMRRGDVAAANSLTD